MLSGIEGQTEPSAVGSLRHRLPALDGVRGIAIAAVLLTHYWPRTGPVTNPDPSWADVGAFGVDLFFVLSGFLITGILLDTRRSLSYFSTFYTRRIFRLLPLYYLYLLFLAVILPEIHRLARTSMEDYTGSWWWYIAYFCNWKPGHAAADPYLGHFWSLAIEEQFYLIWPAVVLFTSTKRLTQVCISLILFSLGLRCLWSIEGVWWNTIYRLTISRFDPLAMGALVAIALRTEAWRTKAIRLATPITVAGLAGFLVVAIAAGGPQWEHPAIHTFGALLADAGFAGLVLFAATVTTGPAYRALSSATLVALGKYSYCIYVIHVVVFAHLDWVAAWLIRRAPGQTFTLQLGAAVCATALSFAIARLSWNYFEAPVIAKGRAWFGDRFDPLLPQAAVAPNSPAGS